MFLKILNSLWKPFFSGPNLSLQNKFVVTNGLVKAKSQRSRKYSKTSLKHLYKHSRKKYMEYDLSNI